VTFESGASLATIIEGGDADLTCNIEIEICHWDGILRFRGYSVSIIPGINNLIRLVKKAVGS
jgi:hypothetical protein